MANSPTQALTGTRLPAAVWTLGFVSLLMDISSEMIHSLLPVFLVTALGASALVVGLIEGIAEATALIVKVFSGVLSDYWRKRKSLAVPDTRSGHCRNRCLPSHRPQAWSSLRALSIVSAKAFAVLRVMRWWPISLRTKFGARRLIAAIARHGRRLYRALARTRIDAAGANDFRAVFWVAVIPGALAVALLVFGIREPERDRVTRPMNPIHRDSLRQLSRAYWWVVAIGSVFTLARFSEAFLVLRAEGGCPSH